ncbi:hypothetical protein CFP56_006096 [Quercus suber]|uniref:Wall-associated receptor kinase galacturonan-binding domain-containing protein n=1 Tax=Quercus suber TaxID=58331 RepID=A0AAW0L8F2_QUESU
MKAHHLALSSLITLSFFLAILPPSYCTDDACFVDCSRPYECGRIINVSYPFWGVNRPEYCVSTLIPVQNKFKCILEGSDRNNNAYFVNESLAKFHFPGLAQCRGKIHVPISRNAIIDESAGVVHALNESLRQGFEVD